MSTLISYAQRTAGNVGTQLQSTTSKLLPPAEREKKLRDLRDFTNRNPKLTVSRQDRSVVQDGVDISLGLPRFPNCTCRPSSCSVSYLRRIYLAYLLINRTTLRPDLRPDLHVLRGRHCALLPRSHTLSGQLCSYFLLPLVSCRLPSFAALQRG